MDKLAKAPSLEAKTLYLIENNKLVEKALPKGKRCDMHCHDKFNLDTNKSTLYVGTPLTRCKGFGIGVRESYVEPEEIYRVAKARGMDFVTASSHNTIKGPMQLIEKYDDVLVSGEYDVNGSDAGHVIHSVVAGHEYAQRNPWWVHKKLLNAAHRGHEYFKKTCELDYGLFCGGAHLGWISSPKLEMKPEYLHSWLETFDHWEINGDIQLENKLIKRALEIFLEDGKKKFIYAGSDCHCLNHVGLTFTETLDSKIDSPKEFLEALKKGEVGIGSYFEGDFAERFHGSVKMSLEDIFTGVKHYITRETHNRKKIILGSALIPPIGIAIGLAVITIPYAMAFIEKTRTERRTKKLAEDYFDYLESLETRPLEEKIESLIEEQKEIKLRYAYAKQAIKNRSLIASPVGWAKFVIKLLGKIHLLEADYNFKLDKDKDDDIKKLPE